VGGKGPLGRAGEAENWRLGGNKVLRDIVHAAGEAPWIKAPGHWFPFQQGYPSLTLARQVLDGVGMCRRVGQGGEMLVRGGGKDMGGYLVSETNSQGGYNLGNGSSYGSTELYKWPV